MALPSRPLVVTGQQIGAGWTPALSVAKALAAMALAQRLGGEAVYWLADEDHDREGVARSCPWGGTRPRRHRFRDVEHGALLPEQSAERGLDPGVRPRSEPARDLLDRDDTDRDP